MAKKSNAGKRVTQTIFEYTEYSVLKLYNHGVLQSTIFHTIILLILALTFSYIPNNQKLKPIEISFVSSAEISEIEMSQTINIPIPIHEESTKEQPVLIPEEEPLNIDSSAIAGETDNKNTVKDYNFLKEDLLKKIDEKLSSSIDDFPSEFPEENSPEPLMPIEKKTTVKMKPKTKKNNTRGTASQEQPRNRNIFGYGSLLSDQNSTGGGEQNRNSNGETGMQNGAGVDNNALNEINKRLIQYGAKTGDVQVSLAWNTVDDLDLHVLVNPMGSNINWTTRWGACGGMLDIDMNAHPNFLNNRPIENIFWAVGRAPVRSEYVVGVHLFRNWSGANQVNAVLAIKIDGKIQTFPVIAQLGNRVIPVTTFKR